MIDPGILSRLADIVGSHNVLTDTDDTASYHVEPRGKYFGKSAAVVRPGDSEEVSAIMRLAHDTETPVVPQGGNTGLVGGQIPFESGEEIVLSLSRMNKILDVDVDGNTLCAEAGAVLQDVQQTADAHDRLFPLSLASQGSCQIGGNLASNAGGVQVLAYGNARDLTLGLEVVLADGRIWNGLTGLRKDNSGYDLRDLFIGSEGTLGIITKAVLKLYPKPTEKVTVFLALETLDNVQPLFSAASSSFGPSLTAFELLPRIGVEFVVHHASARDPFSSDYPWYVLMELSAHGDGDSLRTRAETFLEVSLNGKLVADAVIASSLSQAADLWRLRETMSEVQKQEGGSIKHDVSVPTKHIPQFIRGAGDIVAKMIPGARPVPFGHFGDGNIHYNVSQPLDMDKQSFLEHWDRLNEAVYGFALELDGSISAEHGIGRMKRDYLGKTKDPVALEVMRSLKRALDPKGILNPRKVI